MQLDEQAEAANIMSNANAKSSASVYCMKGAFVVAVLFAVASASIV